MPLHALARAGLAVTLLLGLVGTAHALTLKSEEFKTHRRPAVTFPGKEGSSPLPNPSLTAASKPPVLAHQSAVTPPQICPNCGTTGMVRRYRDRWRCEWCHTII